MKTLSILLVSALWILPFEQANAQDAYTQAELDQMLAPVALYPDAVLSNILIASTYPLEVVHAARWVRQNPGIEGGAAVEAVRDMDWDDSVKALVAFPELVKRMDEDLDWTHRLGNAFLAQEGEVVATVQALRQRADRAGHLASNEHVRVIHEQETIVIRPVHTRVVYVPYYDPWVAYGPWWHHAYPPVVWARPVGYVYGRGIFHWGRGISVSPVFLYSGFYWPYQQVVVIHRNSPPKRWSHNPRHRRGVTYQARTRQAPTPVAQQPASFEQGHTLRDTPVIQQPRRTTTTPRRTADAPVPRAESPRAVTPRAEAPRVNRQPDFSAPAERRAAPSRATPTIDSRSSTPPAVRAPAPTRAITPSRPAVAAPARQQAPAQRAITPAPAQRQVPVQREAPALRQAPVQREAPAQRQAPVQRPQPAPRQQERPAPAERVQENRRLDN